MHLSGITAEDRPGIRNPMPAKLLCPSAPFRFFLKWSWRRDLNPRPSDYKSDALPAELRQPDHLKQIAGNAGKSADTLLLRALHGTVSKVSTQERAEQTEAQHRKIKDNSFPKMWNKRTFSS